MVTKLTISPCELGENDVITVKSAKFEVMLNPSSYTYNNSIAYNEVKAQGQSSLQPKFDHYGAEKVNFDIVIDGTGVVSASSDDVKTQIKNLSAIIYQFDGSEHQPDLVRLLWGSFIFFGRLTTMTVEYTLFKPSGEPLRAKVKLAFTRYVGSNEAALKANMSSPDLTHLVEVKAGDSLPLLCFRIYKNSAYYLEVAKANGITNFRDIKPGTKLNFPPLR